MGFLTDPFCTKLNERGGIKLISARAKSWNTRGFSLTVQARVASKRDYSIGEGFRSINRGPANINRQGRGGLPRDNVRIAHRIELSKNRAAHEVREEKP